MCRRDERNERDLSRRESRRRSGSVRGETVATAVLLWRPFSPLSQVLPVRKLEGLIECVENAHPFLEFKTSDNKNESKSTDALKKFVEESPERKINLFRTFLGFVVSGIVLQLADRHGEDDHERFLPKRFRFLLCRR